MEAVILKNFVDKNTGVSYSEGMKAEFETERVKVLSSLGYVKVEKAVKVEKTEKAVKVEEVETPIKVAKTEKKSKKK